MSTIIKLSGEKLWIELSDANEFVALHSKPLITADINAITATLLLYPSPTQDATDQASILTAISNTSWTQVRKNRVSALAGAMYQAYQGDPRQAEAAALQARLDALIALRARLV